MGRGKMGFALKPLYTPLKLSNPSKINTVQSYTYVRGADAASLVVTRAVFTTTRPYR